MPEVRRMAARLFGRMPITHLNPDEIVARGAARFAAGLARESAFDEVVVTNVAPYSMGIETTQTIGDVRLAGTFAPIIPRNAVIPVSRVQSFQTVEIGQKVVNLGVFQGESRLVVDNIRLGNIAVVVPHNKRAHEYFDVRFTYDRDGILEVEVTVKSTGNVLREVFESTAGTLSKDEIARRFKELSSLKLHPRENAENIAALARADRVFQEVLAARPFVQAQSATFAAALEGQDLQQIARARKELLTQLDSIEANTWQFDDV